MRLGGGGGGGVRLEFNLGMGFTSGSVLYREEEATGPLKMGNE